MVKTLSISAAFSVLLCFGTLQVHGQSTKFLTLGIGQQAAWFERDALQSSDFSVIQYNDLSIKSSSLFLGYEKISEKGIFHRGWIGFSTVDLKNVFDAVNDYSDIKSTYTVSNFSIWGRFGYGPVLESGRIQFIFGPQLALGYGFPVRYSQDFQYYDIADSTTARRISETRNPAGISSGLEIFFSLRYQLTKRFYIGLEPRIGAYLIFINGNIETTRTTYNAAGIVIEESEELTEFKRANFQSSFYLSPPILSLSFRL
jgi:hypothetical protein